MRRLSLLLSALALLSCSQQTQAPYAVSTKSVHKTGPNYSLKLEYPQLTGVSEAINKQLAESALIHLEQVEDDPLPIDEFAKNLAEDSAVTNLKRESIMTVAHKTIGILTTRCQTTDGEFYEVYDLKTGRRLEFNEIVEPGKLASSGLEPNLGLLSDGIIYNGTRIPYDKLKGVLKPQFLP